MARVETVPCHGGALHEARVVGGAAGTRCAHGPTERYVSMTMRPAPVACGCSDLSASLTVHWFTPSAHAHCARGLCPTHGAYPMGNSGMRRLGTA